MRGLFGARTMVARVSVVVATVAVASLLPGCDQPPDDAYLVGKGKVRTGISVRAFSKLVVTSTHELSLGGGFGPFNWGAPKLDADGDSASTPIGYPVPEMRKNSLICQVGATKYQCGTSAEFTPDETGELVLFPNDLHPEDNEGAWWVFVDVEPPVVSVPPAEERKPTTRKYGPVAIIGEYIHTNVDIPSGSTIRTEAEGRLDFGVVLGGAIYDADGHGDAPSDFVAPDETAYSLVYAVGGTWYGGGTDSTNTIDEGGLLTLAPNDGQGKMDDNSRGWTVTVTVTPPEADPAFDPLNKWTPVKQNVGPYTVTSYKSTNLVAEAGTAIRVISNSGRIDFCCWPASQVHDANGQPSPAPLEWPAPGLRKYSLVLEIGGAFYQAGMTGWIVPFTSGPVTLWANDDVWDDNSGADGTKGWEILLSQYSWEVAATP